MNELNEINQTNTLKPKLPPMSDKLTAFVAFWFLTVGFLVGFIASTLITDKSNRYPTDVYIYVEDQQLVIQTKIETPSGNIKLLREDKIDLRYNWVEGAKYTMPQKFIGNVLVKDCNKPEEVK